MAQPHCPERTLYRPLRALAIVGVLVLVGCTGDDADDGDAGDDVSENDGELATCGGLAAPPCGAGFYCDFPDDSCGVLDQTGVCRPLPDACDDVFEPVCACDGVEYENACSAAAAGVDASTAECAEAESFACGDTECAGDGEYCTAVVPGIPDAETSYSCADLPDDCDPAICDCFDGPACDCAADDDGNLTITCYAP